MTMPSLLRAALHCNVIVLAGLWLDAVRIRIDLLVVLVVVLLLLTQETGSISILLFRDGRRAVSG